MISKSAKIYVAGHTGLVGSTIYKSLQENGFTNLVTRELNDLDLRNQQATDNFFKNESPEYVFLAAAKVGGILANNNYKADFIFDNISIGQNVIYSAYKYGAKRLLNLGSSCIYPKYAQQPISETELLSGSLEPTNEPYAIAKIATLKLCRYFNEQYGTDFISLMPTNLYGINDNYNLETSHVLPAILRKTILAKALQEKNYDIIRQDIKKRKIGFGLIETSELISDNEIDRTLNTLGIFDDRIEFWGTGKGLREFLFSGDLADACLYFMNNCSNEEIGECLNIGSGIEISIENLAYLIKNILEYKGKILFTGNMVDGTPRKLLNTTKATNLGWAAKISLEDGIRKVLDSY